MTRWTLAVAAALALCDPGLYAHHSIFNVYDSSCQATLDGTVAEFQLVNPHPFLFVDVAGGAGATSRPTDAACTERLKSLLNQTAGRWRLEMDNRGELAAIGVTASTFKRDERVVVRGSLARAEARSMYLMRLDRPADGFWYEQVGQSPRIKPAAP